MATYRVRRDAGQRDVPCELSLFVLVKNRFGAVRVYIWRLFRNNGMSAEMKISQKMGGAKQKLGTGGKTISTNYLGFGAFMNVRA